MSKRQERVQAALADIREIICEILFEHHPHGLRSGTLQKHMGLVREGKTQRASYKTTLVARGQLYVLQDAGQVWQPRGPYCEWALTPQEYDRRQQKQDSAN